MKKLLVRHQAHANKNIPNALNEEQNLGLFEAILFINILVYERQ